VVKEVLINGLLFTSDSPSEYILVDYEKVLIRYRPKKCRIKTLLEYTTEVAGQRRPRFSYESVLIPEWVLIITGEDGNLDISRFATLTHACTYLRELLSVRDEDTG
jgi:hypothetical protein